MQPALPNPTPNPAAPLTPEQLRQFADAQQRGRKIRRACSTARFQAWSISIFAAFTIIFSLFDPPGLLLGIGMAVTGFFQFQLGNRLSRLDLAAPRRLAWNQLALGAMVVLYAIWGLFHAGSNALPPEVLAAAGGQDIGPMLRSAEDLARMIAILVYATVAFAAVLGQGWAAWYYFSREKYVRGYLAQTPQWIADLQRLGGR